VQASCSEGEGSGGEGVDRDLLFKGDASTALFDATDTYESDIHGMASGLHSSLANINMPCPPPPTLPVGLPRNRRMRYI